MRKHTNERHAGLILCMILLAPAHLCQAGTVAGYRGDGTGVYRDAKPPATFSESSILWKAPLAHFGHSSPIVVGDQVLAISEGGWKTDFPVLQAFDVRTGQERWRRELNHPPATGATENERREIEGLWHRFLAGWREGYEAQYQFRHGDREAAIARFKALNIRARKGDDYGGEFKFLLDKPSMDRLKKSGLMGETWREGGALGVACVGHAYATPVSDGQQIFVATAFGGFFAFAPDGTPKWVKYYPGKMGEYCRNGRSPLLYRNLLISDITALARAMDIETGDLKWSAPVGEETICTPVIVTIGGQDILLCHGPTAFRLPDGAPIPVEGWKNPGATMLVKSDEPDVVFFTGGGEHGGWEAKGQGTNPPPAAIRFTLSGDTLKAQVLWSGIDGKSVAEHTGLVYHKGRLYHRRGFILDAGTGAVVKGGDPKKGGRIAVPATRHLLALADERLFGFREKVDMKTRVGRGIFEAYSLEGEKLAELTITPAPLDPGKERQIQGTTGKASWGIGYGCPFTLSGNRVYLRTHDELIAVGNP